jgi:hypothetical protein
MGGSGSGRPPVGKRGGGGGGGGGGRRPRGDGGDPCACFVDRVVLASPKPKVIAKLKEKDILKVELKDGKPPVLAVTKGDEVAGTIIPTDLSTLVACIKKGYHYEANVVEIDGGSCTVEIQPRGK